MAVGAAVLSLVSVVVAGTIVGWRAKLPGVGSLNLSFTLLARGEFSIIIASLAQAAGLLGILQPFAALYVLILAGASPLLEGVRANLRNCHEAGPLASEEKAKSGRDSRRSSGMSHFQHSASRAIRSRSVAIS